MDNTARRGLPASGRPAPPASPGPATDQEPVQDERLLAAAARVLRDAGWEGLTIEAVAEAAGLSRVTAWRLGASREALIASLLSQLGQDYRQAMWPAMVGTGTARERLDLAIDALFAVIDSHLPLLLASNTICWPYVHLRGRHGWTSARARQRLRGLLGPRLDPG